VLGFSARARRRRLPHRSEVADRRHQHPRWTRPPVSSSTAPRASQAGSRTAPSCVTTRVGSSKARSSPPRQVHAYRVIIALKRSFAAEVHRTRAALAEMRTANVLPASIDGTKARMSTCSARRAAMCSPDR
jgi:hypothetical protein